MPRRLEFRQTNGQRAFNAAVLVGGIGILVARMFPEPGAALWIAVSVAIVLVALCVWRMLRLCLIADGDELVICNMWWTTRLRRNGIEGFRVAGILRPPYKTIKVDRRLGGAVGVDVFLSAAVTPSARRRRDDAVDRLYDWLDESTDQALPH